MRKLEFEILHGPSMLLYFVHAEFSWYYYDMNNQFFNRKGYSHLNNLILFLRIPLVFDVTYSSSTEDEFWFVRNIRPIIFRMCVGSSIFYSSVCPLNLTSLSGNPRMVESKSLENDA